MKRTILTAILVAAALTAAAQHNRYGMNLTPGPARTWTVTNAANISKIFDLGTLPPEKLYTPYRTTPVRIADEDYKGCTTSEKYIFKDYGTYKLDMVVDLPIEGTGPFPFIIYVHGGGWRGGNTSTLAYQSKYLASHGIAGVRITYTLVKDGGNIALGMREMDEAFDFIAAHADDWHLDMTRFGYMAGSAGTPLAALSAFKRDNCRVLMGCNGIYDFTDPRKTDAEGLALFAGVPLEHPYFKGITEGELRGFSPIHNLRPGHIPAIIVFHGTADTTISYLHSVALTDRAKALGGVVDCRIYPGYIHAFYGRSVSDLYEEITISMLRFAGEAFAR